MKMRTHYYRGLSPHEFYRAAYHEWGDPDNDRVLICVHGLTRNGRDFDYFARALAADYRVICPDVVGRGDSDYLMVKDDYGYPLYCAEIATLMAKLDVNQVDWVGTSMGGLIGMMLAATPKNPIRKLVLNDVGPFIPKAALKRIMEYIGAKRRFRSLQEVETYIRDVNAPFGPLTDDQWRHLSKHYSRQTVEGDYLLAYDPGVVLPLTKMPELTDIDLWPIYDAVKTPVLLLRGVDSDILLRDTAKEMQNRGPKAQLVEVADTGHAPALMDGAQIDLVRKWLG